MKGVLEKDLTPWLVEKQFCSNVQSLVSLVFTMHHKSVTDFDGEDTFLIRLSNITNSGCNPRYGFGARDYSGVLLTLLIFKEPVGLLL